MTKLRLSCFGRNGRRQGALGGQRAAGKEGTAYERGRPHERSRRPAGSTGAEQNDVALSQGRRSWSRLDGV